jgi:hypothetical protein
LYFRTTESDWSIGKVDINEIGTSSIVLPRKSKTEGQEGDGNPIILNIDVRFSDPDDASYITITVWESKLWKDFNTKKFVNSGVVSFSIRNDSNQEIVVRQSGSDVIQTLKKLDPTMDSTTALEEYAKKFQLVIQPDEWLAYGWIDPNLKNHVDIAWGNAGFETEISSSPSRNFFSSTKVIPKQMMAISVDSVGDIVRAHDGIVCRVKTSTHGKYLHIEQANDEDKSAIDSPEEAPSVSQSLTQKEITGEEGEVEQGYAINVCINLKQITVSMIADRPTRREFLALYLNDIHLEFTDIQASAHQNAQTLLSFHLGSAQIDNFSESTIHPVMLWSSSSQVAKSVQMTERASAQDRSDGNSDSKKKFIYFMLAQETPKQQKQPIVKYLGFCMLDVTIAIDSASILLYLSDLHRDLLDGLVLNDDNNVLAIPTTQSFNASMANDMKKRIHREHDSIATVRQEIVSKAFEKVQSDKVFIESLEIHPIKIILFFTPSRYPRAKTEIPMSVRWMTKLEAITTIEGFELQLNSFTANHAFESIGALVNLIVQNIINDLTNKILGVAKNFIMSLNALGKPAGLCKKIGNGVQNFFYEVSVMLILN